MNATQTGDTMNTFLDNPSVTKIESAPHPPWMTLKQTGDSPTNNVRINTADLNNQIQSRPKLPPTTITIKDNTGTTRINLNIQELDADGDNPINTETNNGQPTTGGAGASLDTRH